MNPSLRFGTRLPYARPGISWYDMVESVLTLATSLGDTLLQNCASPVFRLVSRTSLLVMGLMMILSSRGSLLPALSLPHQSGFFSSVMWSSFTASVRMNGPVPALKALRVKSSPAASTTLRETIIPARSTSNDSRGENDEVRLKRTVDASTTSTLATGASSPRRTELSVRYRSMFH